MWYDYWSLAVAVATEKEEDPYMRLIDQKSVGKKNTKNQKSKKNYLI